MKATPAATSSVTHAGGRSTIDEIGRIIGEMEETLADLENDIEARLATHIVELAFVRRELIDGGPFRGPPALADDPGKVRAGFTLVEAIMAARDRDPDEAADETKALFGTAFLVQAEEPFRTFYHCPHRKHCDCPPGEADRNCPGRSWAASQSLKRAS